MKLHAHIQYNLLHPATMLTYVEQLCREAQEKNVAAVCVPPLFVKKANELLAGTSIKVSTVIGYPFGYNVIEAKLAEIIMAMVDGCDEMEVCINLIALKNGDWQYLARELSTIAAVIQKKGKIFTVVIDDALLTDDELVKCCDLYGVAGINYFSLVNDSSGVALLPTRINSLRTQLSDAVKIKAAGNYCTEEQATALLQAGADIITLPFSVK